MRKVHQFRNRFVGGLLVEAHVFQRGADQDAAVIAREQGKVCLVGCSDLRVNETSGACTFGVREFREGDVLTLDGLDGRIYSGAIPSTVDRPADAIARVAEWRLELAATTAEPSA